MAFLRHHHLWPIWRRGSDFWGRMRWVTYRWWTFALRKWYRQRTCQEHVPMSVRLGKLRDLLDADGNFDPTGGHQRVLCAYCGATIQDFA